MHIPGPNSNYRIDPIQDRSDENEAESKRRREGNGRQGVVFYKGRRWDPNEKHSLSVKPKFDPQQRQRKKVVFDKVTLDRARALFNAMTTLEEKIAQLCLYETEAIYDASDQNETEKLLIGWQIGGLVFTAGDYRRQNYLIDRYQEVSKTPLLIGNDFRHGLSFYYREEEHTLPRSEEMLSDLGKAIMGLNRSLRVHFQYDRDELLSDELARAFRKGIRQAKGLIARATPEKNFLSAVHQDDLLREQTLPELQQSMMHTPGEISSIKTLHICDLRQEGFTEEKLLRALRNDYDCFLCSKETVRKVITTLAAAVINGHMTEMELDRLVMKILYLKARL